MKVPDWMKLPLVALGLSVKEIEEYTPDNTGFTGSMAAPDRVGETIGILETLFAANLLNVDLPEGPVREGEAILVRGMLMRVERVQDKRLVLRLPSGRKFRRRYDARPVAITAKKDT
jgi:hypothetical protein